MSEGGSVSGQTAQCKSLIDSGSHQGISFSHKMQSIYRSNTNTFKQI